MARFSHLNLEQIETKYRHGLVTPAELAEYLREWNATPGRFTYAFWSDGAIRQAEYREDGTLPAWVPIR